MRSVEGLGGWTGSDLVSLYIMLGIGVAIMLYVRFTGGSGYFSLPRETYEPTANAAEAAEVTETAKVTETTKAVESTEAAAEDGGDSKAP